MHTREIREAFRSVPATRVHGKWKMWVGVWWKILIRRLVSGGIIFGGLCRRGCRLGIRSIGGWMMRGSLFGRRFWMEGGRNKHILVVARQLIGYSLLSSHHSTFASQLVSLRF